MSHSTTSGGGRVTAAVARDRQDLAALAQAGANGAPQVGDRSAAVGAQPARAPQVERQHQAADFPLRLGRFRRRSSPRNPSAAAVPGRTRSASRRVIGGSSCGFGGSRVVLRESLGDAAGGGRRLLRLRSFCASSSAIAAACSAADGITPEQGKSLVEHLLVLVAMHHGGAQRGARLDLRRRGRCAVIAFCAAIVSAGPTGRPARRNRRAKCMTFAASREAVTPEPSVPRYRRSRRGDLDCRQPNRNPGRGWLRYVRVDRHRRHWNLMPAGCARGRPLDRRGSIA